MPTLSDVERIHLQLLSLGQEARVSAQWNEKIESFDSLQRRSFEVPIEKVKEQLKSTSANDKVSEKGYLSRVIEGVDLGALSLDVLPDSAGTLDISDISDISDQSSKESGTEVEYDEDALADALDRLPDELKGDIVKILTDSQIASETLATLIDSIIAGKSARRIRAIVRTISTKRRIPSKREEVATREYVKDQSIAAFSIRTVLASMLILLLLAFAWRVIYRPISSHILYTNAINAVREERLEAAEILFDGAERQHRFGYQLLGIASALRDQKEYERAERYYQRYISTYPKKVKGVAEYVQFVADDIGNRDRALALATAKFNDGLINRALLRILGDLHITRGDDSLRGAPFNVNETRVSNDIVSAIGIGESEEYERARFYYAGIIDRYGLDFRAISNMIRFFIRVDREDEALEALRAIRGDEYREIRPLILAELIEYLITKGRLEEIGDLIRDAELITIMDASIHFQLFHYFTHIDNARGASESLKNAEILFAQYPPRTPYQEELLIRLYAARARASLEEGNFENALRLYNRAITRFEESRESGILFSAPIFGALYARRGTVYYMANDANDIALQNYAIAQEHLYDSPEMQYHIGNIHYRNLRYEQAIQSFGNVIDAPYDDNALLRRQNALYALGNSFLFLNGYATAIGYYRELINLLDGRVERNATNVLYEEDRAQRQLQEMYIATYNNMGVSYARLHQIQGDQGHIQKSLFYLQRAYEEYIKYTSALAADTVPYTRSLPYRNNFAQLHGSSERLQIYRELPRTLRAYSGRIINESAVGSSIPSDPRVLHTEFP